SIINDLDKELNVAADSSYLWTPPYIKGAMSGEMRRHYTMSLLKFKSLYDKLLIMNIVAKQEV
ncbi:hypothetical protein EF900_17535, partial [Staphylococcus aureus]